MKILHFFGRAHIITLRYSVWWRWWWCDGIVHSWRMFVVFIMWSWYLECKTESGRWCGPKLLYVISIHDRYLLFIFITHIYYIASSLHYHFTASAKYCRAMHTHVLNKTNAAVCISWKFFILFVVLLVITGKNCTQILCALYVVEESLILHTYLDDIHTLRKFTPKALHTAFNKNNKVQNPCPLCTDKI